MVRISVLVGPLLLFLGFLELIMVLVTERLSCMWGILMGAGILAECSRIAEQHRQCRASWQAPGPHQAFLKGGRKILERHAASW